MKIAVWYHCRLSGPGIPSPDAAFAIAYEQMRQLESSGLAAAADQLHAGINGDDGDGLLLASILPARAELHVHGADAHWEYPTLAMLQQWLEPGWAVLYHHSKGVTIPQDSFHHIHRRTMSHYLVENWSRCVADLERGYDAVGINLVDPVLRPVFTTKARFFAGNFWWAKSEWLMRLPRINPQEPDRMHAEGWIMRTQIRPRTIDYERPNLTWWAPK